MSSAKSVRLDLMLVVRGLASSRTRAKSLIEQGLVKVAGSPALKASQTV
jgi:predicted rRNA methylase YqxC with S4 and FtsJ domains